VHPRNLAEIPEEHAGDRPDRQKGGEAAASAALSSFLSLRGAGYASGISSPNSSWRTGSRLSPYLTWGHVSLKTVLRAAKRRAEEIGRMPDAGPWPRSLAAFRSRLCWRTHFVQKLESEPEMETLDVCPAFRHLRRRPGDWNDSHYAAWSMGATGYPYVDACMRCLLKHGWLNFRARAMLVSFATFNLWLDWKGIAPHLARVFLDYEPGIHYPQLQMQAGTTGINAMRVYNVTKQGIDQDPRGLFIRKYVPELRNVASDHIHEPCKMSLAMQKKVSVFIGDVKKVPRDTEGAQWYPAPIVDAQKTAKIAKDRVNAVRKLDSTKILANQVYIKHGSRAIRTDSNGSKPKALSSTAKRIRVDMIGGQRSIRQMFSATSAGACTDGGLDSVPTTGTPTPAPGVQSLTVPTQAVQVDVDVVAVSVGAATEVYRPSGSWNCAVCTFINEKPFALACGVCNSVRS